MSLCIYIHVHVYQLNCIHHYMPVNIIITCTCMCIHVCTCMYMYTIMSFVSVSVQSGILPPGALEVFCSDHPYTPFFHDLDTESVSLATNSPRFMILFLATALCKPAIFRTALESLSTLSSSLEILLSYLDSQEGKFSAYLLVSLSVVFPSRDEQDQSCYDLWRETVCEMLLVLSSLRPLRGGQPSPVVSM